MDLLRFARRSSHSGTRSKERDLTFSVFSFSEISDSPDRLEITIHLYACFPNSPLSKRFSLGFFAAVRPIFRVSASTRRIAQILPCVVFSSSRRSSILAPSAHVCVMGKLNIYFISRAQLRTLATRN